MDYKNNNLPIMLDETISRYDSIHKYKYILNFSGLKEDISTLNKYRYKVIEKDNKYIVTDRYVINDDKVIFVTDIEPLTYKKNKKDKYTFFILSDNYDIYRKYKIIKEIEGEEITKYYTYNDSSKKNEMAKYIIDIMVKYNNFNLLFGEDSPLCIFYIYTDKIGILSSYKKDKKENIYEY